MYSSNFRESNMDRLGAMRLFATIADAGSLSGAGRRLGMPLTTVSRKLAALEEALGARLVTRTTRALSLTEPGRDYLEACRRILDELEAAEARLAGGQSEPQGELAITAPVVFGRLHVLPVLDLFLRESPRVSARLLLLDRPVDLIEEGLDIAIRIGVLASSSLIATRVGFVRNVVCASPGYLKVHGAPRAPEQLVDHDCITFAGLPIGDRWIATQGKRQKRLPVRPRLVVNTAEAAVDAAIAGLGITRVLSYQAARAIADGSLRVILETWDTAEIPVSILHREGRLAQPKVQAFVAFAANALRKRMQALTSRSAKRPQR
jgi:DNA-binding transcriptional LysR family regulator